MSAGLVGRDRELARLAALVDAETVGPRLVVVEGEAGIGKTSLVRALAETRPDLRWAVATEDQSAPPFGIWRQLTPDLVIDTDDRFELFDRIVDAVRGSRLAVIDDLQWADEPSVLALRHVVRHLRSGSLTVVACIRSGEALNAATTTLLASAEVRRLTLTGLDAPAATELLRREAGRELGEVDVAAAVEDSRGNPLFLREYGRLLAGRTSVPSGFSDIVRARVARLSPRTQDFLTAASILGDEFELPVVARLRRLPTAAVLGAADEAIAAGVVGAARNSRLRFTHGLVRGALEASLSLQQKVGLHSRAAEALEELHAGAVADVAAEIARHRVAAAVAGERAPAVEWSERAADEAMRSGAYEEAARWYTTALDHGGSALDDVERARLWLRVQAAEVAAGQHRRAFGAGEQAVRLARHDARPELVAAAALGCEPLGDTSSDRTLRNWCVEALAACVEPAQRARLLARLAQTQVYTGGSDEAPRTADQAIELAEASGDDEALVAGLRARQLALSGVEHTATRLDVARRMTEVGERLRRPEVEMWGRLWRIDALWESGDLAAVAAELGQLAWSVEQQHNPIARWHLLRGRAALSQARGEFAEAIARATEAFEILSAADHPGAFGGFVALLGAVGHHTGAVAAPSGVGPHLPPPDPDAVVAELFGNIGPAYALAEAGQLERAEQFYLRAGPPMGWRIPPYFALTAPYVGGYAAMHLGRLDDVAWAREQLLPWRGRHVVGGAGTGAYHGPVELALGVFAAAVDDLAAAEADLLAAVDIAARIGAPAVGVEAAVELATVELRLGRREPALSRLRRVRSAAGNLGMKPWVVRIDEALTETTDPLTPREREVARLVAKGHSNRDIASALVLSERTAANHVQHILTKLGFANRSQIAAWVAANE